MLVDRIITFLMYGVTILIEAIGYSILALSGYGWLWGPDVPYGTILRRPTSHLRTDGFLSGLFFTPVIISLAVSLAWNQPLVAVTVSGSLVVPLLIIHFFGKNFFIPIFYGVCMALVVIFACLLRLSAILLFFFLYLLLVFIGPLLFALFLASI